MTGPRELLRRAAQNRSAAAEIARERIDPRETRPRADAPGAAPTEAHARPGARQGHASYTALMRSHDRVRTQHLSVQGGDGRA